MLLGRHLVPEKKHFFAHSLPTIVGIIQYL